MLRPKLRTVLNDEVDLGLGALTKIVVAPGEGSSRSG